KPPNQVPGLCLLSPGQGAQSSQRGGPPSTVERLALDLEPIPELAGAVALHALQERALVRSEHRGRIPVLQRLGEDAQVRRHLPPELMLCRLDLRGEGQRV